MKFNSSPNELFVTFHDTVRRFFTLIFICVTFVVSSAFVPALAKPIKIVVLGDSLVAGYGLAPGEDFPSQLGKLLDAQGRNVEIINAGVSGDTSSGGLARLDWSVPQDADGVILELGANDALRAVPPELTRKQIETMIVSLKKRGVDVLLAGMMAPPNLGEKYADDFNAIYPDLAQKHNLVFYPFFLQDVAAVPELNLPDGIHPTGEGISIIAKRFLPTAVEFIKRISENGS